MIINGLVYDGYWKPLTQTLHVADVDVIPSRNSSTQGRWSDLPLAGAGAFSYRVP